MSDSASAATSHSVPSLIWELLASSRPHFFALPMLAAFGGVASAPMPAALWPRPVSCVIIAGLGWGGAQLINDVLDRETDAVNAPNRAIAAGRVSVRQAAIVGVTLGLALAAASAALYPCAWVLSLAGVALVLTYNFAKGQPLAGNLALGALFAVTTALGLASALPREAPAPAAVFLSALHASGPALGMSAGIAAWYLQANYEKDRLGDRVAGYRTLAVVVGVRASAVLRALGIVGIVVGAYASGVACGPLPTGMLISAGLVGLCSTLRPIVQATDESALRAYRPAVVASILAMGSLSARLAPTAVSAMVAVAVLVTESAFRRNSNP